MKKVLSLLSVVFLSSTLAQATLVFDRGLPSVRAVTLTKVEKEIQAHNVDGFHSMDIKIYGTAVFSNSCFVPDLFVKQVSYDEGDYNHVNIKVLGVMNGDKICPANFQPVTKRFLIDTIGTTDIMPGIVVNGEPLH